MASKLPPGWEPMPGRPSPRLIVNATGRRGMGKSHLIMTMPRPLAVFDIDLGIKRALPPKPPKDVYRRRFELDINPEALQVQGVSASVKDEMKDKAGKLWNAIVADTRHFTAAGYNIGVDGAAEAWEILRYAEFGMQSNVKHLFTRLNMIYRKWLRLFDNGEGNVCLTSKMKEEWEDYTNKDNKVEQRPSGRWVRAGFGDLDLVVDVDLQLDHGEDGMEATILKSGFNKDLIGMPLAEKDINFTKLLELSFEEE